MPTYSYRCSVCGHSFDVHQAFADPALTTCPECSGALRKLFSSPSVTFKGSGFYMTDSKSGSSSTSSSSSKPSSSASKPASKSA